MPKPDCLRQHSPARAPPRVRTGSLLCHGVQRPSMSCSKYNLKIILHSTGMHCQQAGDPHVFITAASGEIDLEVEVARQCSGSSDIFN